MSYARFSEGDVYLFPTGDGIECAQCTLDPALSGLNGTIDNHRWHTDEPDHRTNVVRALVHLAQHERAGHDVPTRAWDDLHNELITGSVE